MWVISSIVQIHETHLDPPRKAQIVVSYKLQNKELIVIIFTSELSDISKDSESVTVWLDVCFNGESGGEFSRPYFKLLCDGDLLCLR